MLARTRGGETRWDRAVAEAQAPRRRRPRATNVALATTADGLVEGPTAGLRAHRDRARSRSRRPAADASAWPRVAGGASRPLHHRRRASRGRSTPASSSTRSSRRRRQRRRSPRSTSGPAARRPARRGPVSRDRQLRPARRRARHAHPRDARRCSIARSTWRRRDAAAGRAARPRRRPRLRARIVGGRTDALAADDEAFAWIDWAQPLSVLVVGDETAWLQPLFSRDPDVHVDVRHARPPIKAGTGGRGRSSIAGRRAEPPPHPALLYRAAGDAVARRSRAMDERASASGRAPGIASGARGVDPFTLTIEKAHASTVADAHRDRRSPTQGTPLVYVHDAVAAAIRRC